MLKQYLYILVFCFIGATSPSQISSQTIISAHNIKALGNQILDKKTDDFVFLVLDSLTKTPTNIITSEGIEKQLYGSYIKNNQLVFKKTINDYETNLVLDTLPNNLKNNFVGVNNFPFTACDKSKGKYNGRIYVCWADAKNGLNNNDVFLTYSDDGGEAWMERILITFYPNHKHQFMPRFTIDEQTGYLYFLYYSQRNYTGNNFTDVFLTVSKDGGKTFADYQLNTTPITWQKDVPYYKYFSLSIKQGVIYSTWLNVSYKKIHTIYSSLITDSILQHHKTVMPIIFNKEAPFIYSDKTPILFLSDTVGVYDAYLYKATEPNFEMLVAKGAVYNQGNNTFTVDFKKLKLKKGTYVLMLYTKNTSNYVWIQEE